MDFKIGIPGIVFVLLFAGCNKDFDEHYNTTVPTSNVNVWEALQKDADLSSFVNYVKEYKYDTLFQTNNTYTVFAPTNEAFTEFLASQSVNKAVLDYHFSTFFIQSGSIEEKRKIQTLAEKFALFVKNPLGVFLDDISLVFESPLYKNGKYFKMDKVALPKPNLYEYISATNPVLKRYIDSQDSIIVDKELSRPIGFDEEGNTIYDTVAIIYNEFEQKFFQVKEEFRYQTATIVFPKEENYNDALTKMAVSLNSGYTDYKDVPLKWQDDILIPYLLEHGVFENMVEKEEFLIEVRDTVKMKNILGDSIVIDYVPSEKTICSNGYAYNYENFEVPDTLYASPTVMEGEKLTRNAGGNRYFWQDYVTVVNDISYSPLEEFIAGASNDSILKVNFVKGYKGKYSIEFNVDNLFPRKYLMVFRTAMNVGGIFDIYVNGVLVKTMDYYEYQLRKTHVIFSVTGKLYAPQGTFNKFDCWLDNLTEYGKARIKIVYTGPSTVQYNGLVLDYIEFIPN